MVRSGNMIVSCPNTMSQLRQRAVQYSKILRLAQYSIFRRESSFVKLGLFLVICRNWRLSPSMILVVYIILRTSGGYEKNVLKMSQFPSQLFTQVGYCFPYLSLNAKRFSKASSSVTARYTNFAISVTAVLLNDMG